ncbi:MAG: hypothetical protein V4671_05405 [Armatimonadota bacterium]
MPRCQRTFQRLPDARSGGPKTENTHWVCPYCADAESYDLLQDADLLQYARLAEAAAIQDFGRPNDASRTTFLLRGLRPECVFEPGDRRYDIYLQQGSDPLQLRLQIGHEMFHRVCSQGVVFHWTHEMLACLFSVRLLRHQGFEEYAAQTADAYRLEAAECSLQTLLTTDLWRSSCYPPGFYGRAYLMGSALKSAVGWSALCRLARFRVERGAPDVHRWLDSLPEAVKTAADGVLGGTAPEAAAG